jgi:hypothetical protein
VGPDASFIGTTRNLQFPFVFVQSQLRCDINNAPHPRDVFAFRGPQAMRYEPRLTNIPRRSPSFQS